MTAGNWQGNTAPVAGDTLIFPLGSAGATTNNFTDGAVFDAITIADSGYTFAGNSIALGGGIAATYASGSVVFPLAVTMNGGQTVSVADGTLELTGAIGDGSPSDGYSLTKSGAGTLVLTDTSTYTGATMVSAGTLEVDGSIASSSGVGVAVGADLSGSGAVPGVNAAAGSTLQPGSAANPASTAILSSGNINLATGSTFDAYLGGTAVGTGYDQHNVTGTVDLDSDSGGGATLDLTLAFTPAVGDSFIIVANDGTDPIQGTFDGLPEGSTLTVGGQQFQITYAGGPGGNEVVVTCKAPPTVTVTAAPNPSQLGQSATFSVTVSGSWLTPTGTVTFYDGNPGSGGQPIGTPLTLNGSGRASVSTSSLTIGTHQIYAAYSGNWIYFPRTSSLSGGQSVAADVTTTGVSSDQTSATYGDGVALTALVSQNFGGVPTGFVDFFDGSTPIGTAPLSGIGVATFMTTALTTSGSPHSITASYEGSISSQTSASAGYAKTITAAPLTITADSTGKAYGTAVTFDGTEFTTVRAGQQRHGLIRHADQLGHRRRPASAGSPYTITASAAIGTGLSNYSDHLRHRQADRQPGGLTITAEQQRARPTARRPLRRHRVHRHPAWSTAIRSPRSPWAAPARPATAVAGSPYAIAPSDAVGTGLGNYTISYVNGS